MIDPQELLKVLPELVQRSGWRGWQSRTPPAPSLQEEAMYEEILAEPPPQMSLYRPIVLGLGGLSVAALVLISTNTIQTAPAMRGKNSVKAVSALSTAEASTYTNTFCTRLHPPAPGISGLAIVEVPVFAEGEGRVHLGSPRFLTAGASALALGQYLTSLPSTSLPELARPTGQRLNVIVSFDGATSTFGCRPSTTSISSP
jgi:hypothetical protein